MYYADFQDDSIYRQLFIDYLVRNNYTLPAIYTWDAGNIAMAYGEGPTTYMLQVSGINTWICPRDPSFTLCISTFVAGRRYQLFSQLTTTQIIPSPSMIFTKLSCCTDAKNAAIYRKCNGTTDTTTPNPISVTPSPINVNLSFPNCEVVAKVYARGDDHATLSISRDDGNTFTTSISEQVWETPIEVTITNISLNTVIRFTVDNGLFGGAFVGTVRLFGPYGKNFTFYTDNPLTGFDASDSITVYQAFDSTSTAYYIQEGIGMSTDPEMDPNAYWVWSSTAYNTINFDIDFSTKTAMFDTICTEITSSPTAITDSPTTTSPTDATPSPTDNTMSPTTNTVAPTTALPTNVTPMNITPSPTDDTASPTTNTPSPTDDTASPTDDTPSPTDNTPAPTDDTPSPISNDTECEFGLYNYADLDNAASSNGWTIMYYADFQDGSIYKQLFLEYFIVNDYSLRAISNWTVGNIAVVYGQGTGNYIFQISGSSDWVRPIGTDGTRGGTFIPGKQYNFIYGLNGPQIILSLSTEFTRTDCCPIANNAAIYRRCGQAMYTTAEPTSSPTTSGTYTSWDEFPTDFDEITNETFASGNLTIGWLKMYQCQGGINSDTWSGPWPTFPHSFDNFARYGKNAVTMKIIPDGTSSGMDEYDNYAVQMELCTRQIYALNNNYNFWYRVDLNDHIVNGLPQKYTDWIGTSTAKSRIASTCFLGGWLGSAPLYRLSDEDALNVYGRCGDGGIGIGYQISASSQWCYWDRNNDNLAQPAGYENISVWFGFDVNKESCCVSNNKSLEYHPCNQSLPIPTPEPSSSCKAKVYGRADDHLSLSVSRDNGNTFDTLISGWEFEYAIEETIANIDQDTIIRFTAVNEDSYGAFVSTVKLFGTNNETMSFYTTYPLTGFIANDSTSQYRAFNDPNSRYFTQAGVGLITDPEMDPDAYWIWSYSSQNTITFDIDFSTNRSLLASMCGIVSLGR